MRAAEDIVPHIDFGWWETLFMRAGFSLLLWHWYPPLSDLPPAASELRFPTGLAHWFDLAWALEPAVYSVMHAILLAACILYVTGLAFPLSALALLLCYLIPATLQNCVGSISHYYQMITLLLLAQTLAAWFWTFRTRSIALPLLRSPTSLHSLTTRATLQVLAGNYVLCGITKLIRSRGGWLWATRFLPVQFEKTWWQTYYDDLRTPDITLAGYISDVCLEHQWSCVILYGPGLVVELLAFTMLFGRRWAVAIGAAIITMHELIAITMGLHFRQHEWIVFIYAVNAPFWAALAAGVLHQRRRGR